jgi:hypothetical protein
VGVPPVHRVGWMPPDEHGEVQVIAAGEARHPAPSEHLSLADRVSNLDVNRGEA